MAQTEPILRTDGLKKHYSQATTPIEVLREKFVGGTTDPIRAVDGVDLTFHRNEITGVIGESGCGKTTLLETLIGLYEPTEGDVYFDGRPTSEFSKSEWQEYRRRVRIIFQNPYEAMNPKFTVRQTLMEPLQIHGMEQDEELAKDVLKRVNLTPPSEYLDMYESQLSGGEKQRVAIGRELIVEPDVILADEPVSMLDVSTQVSILRLLKELASERDLSIVYISHDLSTVSYVCQNLNVMYLGNVVESGPTREILSGPEHPYTRELLQAIPIPVPDHERQRSSIPGNPPDPVDLPTGCNFKDRCPKIIAPEGYDLTGEEWSDIREFMSAIETRSFEPDTVEEIQRRFFESGLPAGEAGRIVEEAIELLAVSDTEADPATAGWEESDELLEQSFAEQSICATDPVLYPTSDARQTKCHLHYDHEQIAATENVDHASQGEFQMADGGEPQ